MPDPTLASVEDFKTWAGITAATEDALIQDLLNGVTETAQRETGRLLFLGTATERHDGRGGTIIAVRNPPIASVNSITDRNIAIEESDGATMGWLIGPGSTYIEVIGRRFSSGPVVVIEYTGGFTTIPRDLKIGALHQAKYDFDERQHTGMTSKGLGTAQSGGFLVYGLHPRFAAALARYKRGSY